MSDYKIIMAVSEVNALCESAYEAGFRAANPKLYSEIMQPKSMAPLHPIVRQFNETVNNPRVGKPLNW